MNGRVVAILVRPGDRVTAGQPVLTLEAMKMEHVHKAGIDGVVAAIDVAEGEQVTTGRIVAEIGAGQRNPNSNSVCLRPPCAIAPTRPGTTAELLALRPVPSFVKHATLAPVSASTSAGRSACSGPSHTGNAGGKGSRAAD